ncbi:MAG: hypothetical protein LBL24_07505 [Bacteroidales bacterium]|jgi:uncharacterized protein YjcR|nr:hypothetical protein [Bacteroidales bacterium]
MARKIPNYTSLKAKAKDFFLKGKSQKEIAAFLGVSTVTLNNWVRDGNWKEERSARINSTASRSDNIHSIIDHLSGQQLELLKKISEAEQAGDAGKEKELRVLSKGLGDEVSKWNRLLADLKTESRISLSQYLEVMDDIFRHMKAYSLEMYHQTLDFQELHVCETSKRLG